MDVCNPGINAKNLARLVRQETGVELNLNRNQIVWFIHYTDLQVYLSLINSFV